VTLVKQRELQLQKAFDAQKQQAFDLNATSAEYAMLDTELRRVEKLCDIIDTRIKELNVSEDTQKIEVTIIDVARPAASPIRPQKARLMAMGLLVGVMLGVGAAMGLAWMDQRIHSVEEVAALVDAPVLGLVPHISIRQSLAQRGQHVAHDPTSDVAEAYRTIRTAVYFGARNGEGKGNRLLVTSPAPGDGKTTSTSNLAIAMAKAGQRVVLVDADLRRPTQHKVFELDVKAGLSNLMAGTADLAAVIYPTAIENLDVIPAGPVPANPSEILNSQAFADFVDELAARYDHVLIDSPPVAPVTDARILGAMCDATILVIRAEKSTRRVTEHARESLQSVGTRILGVIINDVPRRRDRYGYYYGYSYGYRYRQYGYAAKAEDGANGNSDGDANHNGNGNGHAGGANGKSHAKDVASTVGASDEDAVN
jgi:succinoglycan biosynthesis transport protein ExoP